MHIYNKTAHLYESDFGEYLHLQLEGLGGKQREEERRVLIIGYIHQNPFPQEYKSCRIPDQILPLLKPYFRGGNDITRYKQNIILELIGCPNCKDLRDFIKTNEEIYF